MSRSKSLVIVFSSLCALAACARIPAPSASRRPTQPVAVQEPMGNPSATEPVRSTVEAPIANQLMEPDFGTPTVDEPTYDPSPIQNLEDPSADAPAPEAAQPTEVPTAPRPIENTDDSAIDDRAPPTVPDMPNPDEVVGPRSRQSR